MQVLKISIVYSGPHPNYPGKGLSPSHRAWPAAVPLMRNFPGYLDLIFSYCWSSFWKMVYLSFSDHFHGHSPHSYLVMFLLSFSWIWVTVMPSWSLLPGNTFLTLVPALCTSLLQIPFLPTNTTAQLIIFFIWLLWTL